MVRSNFRFITPLDTQNFETLMAGMATASWPEFMLHDPIADLYWSDLYRDFPEFQFALFDDETKRVVAIGNSLSLAWNREFKDLPEEGWDWAFQQAFTSPDRSLEPDCQCAIQIAIHPDYRNQGLSREMVRQMRKIGIRKNFKNLIAPVRPNLKSLYPLIDIDEYINWITHDGLPFDPWLRVHARYGARIIKSCRASMRIVGSCLEWEKWTGLIIPSSGEYILPGGLVPLAFNKEVDQGIYLEPNVWVVHQLQPN